MPNFTIVIVEKTNQDGTIDGRLVQHCCGEMLEGAIERTKLYAKKGRGTPYSLIKTCSGWVPDGWLYPSYVPLCQTLRTSDFPQNL